MSKRELFLSLKDQHLLKEDSFEKYTFDIYIRLRQTAAAQNKVARVQDSTYFIWHTSKITVYS